MCGELWMKCCKSTCHSVSWGKLAEQRLKALGLTLPWVDSKNKSFAGLGATSSTLGKRRLPFSIEKGSTALCTGRHTGILEKILNFRAGRLLLTLCFVDIENREGRRGAQADDHPAFLHVEPPPQRSHGHAYLGGSLLSWVRKMPRALR